MSRRVLLSFAGGASLAALACLSLSLIGRSQPGTKPEQPVLPKVPRGTGTVFDHGATGDGTTDDWQAVQNAVNAASGAVAFPHGTYRITKTVTVDLAKVGFAAVRGDGTDEDTLRRAGAEGADAGPVPTALRAVIVHVYVLPTHNPLTTMGPEAAEALPGSPPSEDTHETMYSRIALPPSLTGGEKDTVTWP